MKNKQKGFVLPAILIVIALLVIGGGTYVYNNKKTEAPLLSSNTEVTVTKQFQQQNGKQDKTVSDTSESCADNSNNCDGPATPILKVSGPVSLNLNRLGTWTVDAYSLNDKGEGSTLVYSVNWGDTTEVPKFGKEYPPFTHAYSKFGDYNITFTAKDSTGAQTIATTSVSIINTTSAGVNTNQAETKLTDGQIVNALSSCSDEYGNNTVKFTKGGVANNAGYGCTDISGTVHAVIDIIARGDVNGDGYEDSIVKESICGGSCGSQIKIVINQKNQTGKVLDFKGFYDVVFRGAGAGQTGISKISIDNNGNIFITAESFMNPINLDISVTKKFKLEGSSLIEIK